MDKQTVNIFMWMFTCVLLAGFASIWFNLRGKVYYSKYEGLVLAMVGLAASVTTGAIAARSVESFVSLYV